jgi:tetratricopeptide (TPR) repeat protein
VALHEVGEVRLRLGDLDGARDAFQQARQLGRDPQPGISLLRLAEGDIDGATRCIRRALDHRPDDRLDRVHLLPTQVEIAIAAGDLDTARAACDELDEIAVRFDTPNIRAASEHSRGALRLAENDLAAADRHLLQAIRLWEQVNVPYEAARARELHARVHLAEGDRNEAELELQAATSTFVRFGAEPDARRAAELLAAPSD